MAYATGASGEGHGLGIGPAAVGAGISLVGGLFGGGGPPWQSSYDETKAAIKAGNWARVENKARSQFPKVAALAQKALADRAASAAAMPAPGVVVGGSPALPALPGGLDPKMLAIVVAGGVGLLFLLRAGRR